MYESLSEICTFSFKKMHLKMLSVKWRTICLGLIVLKPGLNRLTKYLCYHNEDWTKWPTLCNVNFQMRFLVSWYKFLCSNSVPTCPKYSESALVHFCFFWYPSSEGRTSVWIGSLLALSVEIGIDNYSAMFNCYYSENWSLSIYISFMM